MSEKIIGRRRMIKISSIAALSAWVSPPLVASEIAAADHEQSNTALSDAADEVCYMKALDLASLLRNKRISAREVMQAHLKQIARVNSKVNAIITLYRRGPITVHRFPSWKILHNLSSR
ncbi:MAG TPA: hypothetical protein VE035_07585 [Puia sp.]|nr:hypothetical protein [Puia sp.]